MGLQEQILMDKYMMVVLGFLMIGIPIAFLSPTTGELREQPLIPLFYASIGGIIVVIVYSGYKGKKARQQANRERRRKFKK
jgi:NADH:ubiquinone oxidoreductase subunit 3 (subunit A)